MTRRIGFLGFEGIQATDLVGPADAFRSDAFATAGIEGNGSTAYEVVVIGLSKRQFTSSSGITFRADTTIPTAMALDTLIVPGGTGLRRHGVAERAAQWIASRARDIRRIATVCTGIYGVAPTGLLDGRRVTTHWSACADIARRFPALRVDADALYIKDEKFYTSAGITAGVDLALALIEEDHGAEAALSVAREMVVFLKRPGGQSQFSDLLQFQTRASDRFRDIGAWIQTHLANDLSVETLAARAYLSPRQFARAFRDEFGTTPGAFVEAARLSEASRRLTNGGRRLSIEAIGRSVGYASEDVFRRAFERCFGVTPTSYRSRFASSATRRPHS
ncbi:MAG TPA: DJ-1/PfpI family protein [Gemmatimonadaceae bacterium]